MAHVQIPVEVRFLRIPTKWEVGPEIPAPTLLDPKKLEPERILVPTVLKGSANYIDGWKLRDRFFKLPHTEEAALSFLNDIGLWWTLGGVHGTPDEIPDEISNDAL